MFPKQGVIRISSPRDQTHFERKRGACAMSWEKGCQSKHAHLNYTRGYDYVHCKSISGETIPCWVGNLYIDVDVAMWSTSDIYQSSCIQ